MALILCEARCHHTPHPRGAGAIYTKKTVHEIEVGPIRLSGHWLAEAGFHRGQAFEVAVSKGKLVLRAA